MSALRDNVREHLEVCEKKKFVSGRKGERSGAQEDAPAKAMFGWHLRTVQASLHGTVSTVLTPGSTLRGKRTSSSLSTGGGDDEGLFLGAHVRDPQSPGSPQHGRSARASYSVWSVMPSGGDAWRAVMIGTAESFDVEA